MKAATKPATKARGLSAQKIPEIQEKPPVFDARTTKLARTITARLVRTLAQEGIETDKSDYDAMRVMLSVIIRDRQIRKQI